MTAPRRYRPGATGWVVRSTRLLPREGGGTQVLVSWWYGPTHGAGTTFLAGPLDSSVRVWDRFEDARAAAWDQFGADPALAVVRVSEALPEKE